MRADYAALKQERWGGFSGYDGWFARANNASLGVLAAYNEQVPAFMRLFERERRRLRALLRRGQAPGGAERAERRAALDR